MCNVDGELDNWKDGKDVTNEDEYECDEESV